LRIVFNEGTLEGRRWSSPATASTHEADDSYPTPVGQEFFYAAYLLSRWPTSRSPAMLNEFQKRGVTAVLRIVEEHMRRIEGMLDEKEYAGILYEWKNDLPDNAKHLLSERIRNVRVAIEQAGNRFSLEKQDRRASDDAFGKLPYCWQILEEAKAARLVRYGEVAEGLDRELDPLIEMIITLVLEMESILQRVRGG